MGRQLGGSNRVYVHDEVGEVHFYDPGDDVPKWAAKQITNPKAWGSADTDDDSQDAADQAPASTEGDADGGEGDAKPYPKWKKADLEAEVASRNEGRADDDLIVVDGKGTVADLAAALEGDDAAQADAAANAS